MSRRSRLRPVVVAAVMLACAGAARAAKLPDWAQALADSAPEIGSDLPDHPSRVLFDEEVVEVQPDGRLLVRRRTATQALSPRADEIGFGFFQFDDRTEIRRSKAWHLPPEGRARKSKGAALDVTLDDVFLTDQRSRVVHAGDVEKGSLVFFEFEAVERPFHLAFQHRFHAVVPTDVMRFEVVAPEGWSVRHAWLRRQGPQAAVAGNRHAWEMTDLPAPEEEPMGETPSDLAPLLVVDFVPPPGIDPEPEAFSDWTSLASWWEGLSQGLRAPTPEIAAEAGKALAGAGDDPFARVEAVARHVRDRVRYVAIEIGIGGYRPHGAGEVQGRLYGDCKDKGTLFQSYLSAAGVESYPIFVNASAPDTVSSEIPSLYAFDHFVTGVKVPEGANVPERFAPAVFDAGDLGRILLVDTTNESTSIGAMPTYLQDKTALLVAGDRSRLVTLPGRDPGANVVDCTMEADIAEDLSVAVALEIRHVGSPAAKARRRYRDSRSEYREDRESELRKRWPDGEIRAFEVTEEDDGGAFVERVEVHVPPPRDPASADLLPVFPDALDPLRRVKLTRRESPVRYDYPFTLRFESTVRGVPAGHPLPEGKERDGEGWKTWSKYSGGDGEVRGEWELVVSRLRYGTDELRDLREMWTSAKSTSSQALWLVMPTR